MAEYLASRGKRVTIFHKWSHIGASIDRYSYGTVMQRLEENDVEIITGVRLSNVEGNSITCLSGYSGAPRRFDGFDTVVLVGGSVPDDALYYTLKDNYPFEKVYLSGSAWLPRKMAEATRMGASVGLEI